MNVKTIIKKKKNIVLGDCLVNLIRSGNYYVAATRT